MADIELGEFYGAGARTRGGMAHWAGWAGAMGSLALMFGIGIWGYRLMVRDVSGIPVIRAIEGPMRVQPADPGGEQVANQGLSVNEIAAGVRGETGAELVLAPAPPELLDRDVARIALAPPETPDYGGAADRALAGLLGDDAGDPLPADAAQAQVAAADGAAGADVVPASFSPADAIPASVPGIRLSPRPPARPETILVTAQAIASAVPVAANAAASVDDRWPEVDAATLPPGTRLVQLGAFENAALAREAWGQLGARFEDVMADKQRVIQEATGGGETFYRLRAAGFRDLADAKRFCATIIADKSRPLCVPVALR